MKITLTEMEKTGHKPEHFVHTHLYSDMIFNVIKSYYAFYALDGVESSCYGALKMPDGEVVFAFADANLDQDIAFHVCESNNFKKWRYASAKRLLMCIRRAVEINTGTCPANHDLRRTDAYVKFTMPAGYSRHSRCFRFNVAAAMYLYDTMLDHARILKQYDKSFATKVTGIPYDPLTAEMIAEVKKQIFSRCEKFACEKNAIMDYWQKMFHAFESECYEQCDAEVHMLLDKNSGIAYDMIYTDVSTIECTWYAKIHDFSNKCKYDYKNSIAKLHEAYLKEITSIAFAVDNIA